MQTIQYQGIPIKQGGRTREGVDCWGYVCIIYFDGLGIQLPHYTEVDWDKGSVACMKVAEMEAANQWYQVRPEDRQEFDVVVLRINHMPWHVGVVVDSNRFTHADPLRGICTERLDGIHWKNRIVAYYRYNVNPNVN